VETTTVPTVLLPPYVVDIWPFWVEATFDSGRSQSFHELSVSERQRYTRIATPVLRHRYAASHLLLRHILASYIRTEPRLITYGEAVHGKPYLLNDPTVHFNLSHSEAVGVIAVSRNRTIGVDIEVIRPLPNWENLAQCCFDIREQQWLRRLDRQSSELGFFQLWTIREAYLKALGVGLKVPMQVPFVPSSSVEPMECTIAGMVWTLHKCSLFPQCKSALVYGGSHTKIRVKHTTILLNSQCSLAGILEA
jgi:Phosphopantetheinyl transferase